MSKVTYARLRAEYADLWASLKFRKGRYGRAEDAAVSIMKYRDRYEAVAAEVGSVPWPVVGVIHAMESNFDFFRHLHNGDPLTAKTVRVPKNRPAGSPPFTWHASAVDALRMKKFGAVKQWPVERIAFELERYNGFGYRLHYPHVLSPYLWAGTEHYTRGKYTVDGEFSDRAVSKQTGALAILRALLDIEPGALDGAPAIDQTGAGDAETAQGGTAVADAEPNPRSEFLPLYRPKQTDAVTRAVLDKFADLTPPEGADDEVRVLFVRGYYSNSFGGSGNDRAVYDDAAFVVTPEGAYAFNANTDPSVFRPRVATIKAPQAIRYRPGLHGYNRKGGAYPAFRQDANCVVVRDNVGDDTGMFHVNLHRGGERGTSSLGCLTVPPHQWDEFRDTLNAELSRYDQETFFVTLVEYDGDKPPVKVAPAAPANPDQFTTQDGLEVGLAASLMLAVVGWWETISTAVGGLF